MKVQCPSCGAAYQIDGSKIPRKGAYARCRRCQTRFFLGTYRRSGRDRRSGVDRRKAFHTVEDDFPYLLIGGTERRSWRERRWGGERRAMWPRVRKRYIYRGELITRGPQS